MADPARRIETYEAEGRRFAALMRIDSTAVSAPDKLAWWWLWQQGRGNREQFVTSADEVAAGTGTKADAGRKRLKSLAKLDAIEARHERSTGSWLIQFVADPEHWARERNLILREADPQRELFLRDDHLESDLPEEAGARSVKLRDDAGEETVNDHTQATSQSGRDGRDDSLRVMPWTPPDDRLDDHPDERLDDRSDVRPSPSLSSKESKYINASSSRSCSSLPKSQEHPALARGDGRSSGRSSARLDDRSAVIRQVDSAQRQAERRAERPPREQSIGAVMSHVRSPADMVAFEADERQRVEAYASWLQESVACPRMMLEPCLKIAQLVIDGKLPSHKVQAVLIKLDRRQDIRSRSSFANTCFKKLRQDLEDHVD